MRGYPTLKVVYSGEIKEQYKGALLGLLGPLRCRAWRLAGRGLLRRQQGGGGCLAGAVLQESKGAPTWAEGYLGGAWQVWPGGQCRGRGWFNWLVDPVLAGPVQGLAS